VHNARSLRISDEGVLLIWAGLVLFVEAVYNVIDAGLGGCDKVIARGILKAQTFSTEPYLGA
jgi:hypothetical protein